MVRRSDPDSSPSGAEGLEDPASLEKVRDILFGAQHRDMEDRLGSLEAALRDEVEGARTSLQEEIQQLREALAQQTSLLEKAVAGLDEQKLDRTRLAALLRGLAGEIENGSA